MSTSRFISVLLALILTTGLFAQNLSIQGVARDNTGQSLPDGNYAFTFRLYLAETGGTVEWTEVQTLNVLNGVFSAVLGSPTSSMAGLDFDQEYWLSIQIDNNGELAPRTKLILSPYAIMAEQENQDNVFPLSGPVGIGVSNPTTKLHIKNGSSNTRVAIDRANETVESAIEFKTGGAGKALFGLDNNMADLSLWGYDGGNRIITFGLSTGKVGIGTFTPQSNLHVIGDFQISNSSFPVGITSQLGGTTPLLNFDANFIFPNRNTTYRGGAFRVDTRGSSYQLFQWLSRAAGSTDLPMIMSLTEAGNLDVAGDITYGTQNYHPAAAIDRTKIIHGWISAAGGIENGTGFTCTKPGTGHYRITFSQAFSDEPSVTVTGVGGDAVDNMWSLIWISSSYIDIISRDHDDDSSPDPQDCRFMFIAIGNR